MSEHENWTHVKVERKSNFTTTNTQEQIDGFLYVVTTTYDNNKVMIEKHIIRADLCKA